ELPVSGVEIQRKPKRTSSWSDSDYRDNFDDYGDDRGSRRDYGNSRRYEGFGSGGYGGYGGGYSGGYSGGYGYGGGGSSKGYGSLDTRSKSEIKAAGALSGLTKGNTIEKVKPGYDVGDRVSHIKFGEGTVTKLEDQPKDYEVTVEFDLFGVKVMKAGFAKLTKL
ncbi:MAG: ATP-dependent DNA helicase PcrA, partial [Eubacteriales bacterium]|nr:ATP-dependent DNA helicase PcrA [Eubacteriales bacterium]